MPEPPGRPGRRRQRAARDLGGLARSRPDGAAARRRLDRPAGQSVDQGQIAELNRRGGTVFLTLRDPVASVSARVICTGAVLDATSPPPAVGARVVIWAKPEFNSGRGSFALTATQIKAVGIGERGPPRTAADGTGSRRTVRGRAQAQAAVPAGDDRPDLRPGLGGRAGRAAQRCPPLAGRAVPGRAGRRAGPACHRGNHLGAAAARRRSRGSTSSSSRAAGAR